MNMIKLSVIIPVRQTLNNNILERLQLKKILGDNLEVIVVDDGSINNQDVENICKIKGWNYIYLNTKDAPFSLARARNAGIKKAIGEYVYFEDADFFHKTSFYKELINLIPKLKNSPFNFAAIPTIFLSEGKSLKLVENINNTDTYNELFDLFVSEMQFTNPDEKNDLCDSYAIVGSNILVKRNLCYQVGLFDEFFNSWGGEDRDFIFRLLNHNSKIIKPVDFFSTKNWKIHRTSAYEGWRSLYKIHGEWVSRLGIYAIHLYHPDYSWKDTYSRKVNMDYAANKAIDIGNKRLKVSPVPIKNEKLNIFIGRNPTFNNDEVIDYLENVKILDYSESLDVSEFGEEIVSSNPDKVFFQNPYGSEYLLELWRYLKSKNIICVCVERGALPNSIYFDKNGFCAESCSYDPENWLKYDEYDANEYYEKLKEQSSYLEPQGNSNIELLKPILTNGNKNVLVVLQSITDSTTRFFCGNLNNYNEFLSIVHKLPSIKGFNFLVKNHPLNKVDIIDSEYLLKVDEYKLYDLIDNVDIIITLNSGVGVLALAAEKPVICMGKSFYSHDGLAMQANSYEELISCLNNPVVDIVKVNKFYSYLVNHFYSFAEWSYLSRDYSNNTKMSMMNNISYYDLKLFGKKIPVKPKMNKGAMILAEYGYYFFVKKNEVKEDNNLNSSKKNSVKRSHLLEKSGFILRPFLNERKISKLVRDPYLFFHDSRHQSLKKLKYLFK